MTTTKHDSKDGLNNRLSTKDIYTIGEGVGYVDKVL